MYYTREEVIEKFASEYTLVTATYQNVEFVVTLDDFLSDGWSITNFS